MPRPIRILQRLGILQGPAGHAVHHRLDKDTACCVITPCLNPLLDGLGFWRTLERLVVRPDWAPRRPGLSTS